MTHLSTLLPAPEKGEGVELGPSDVFILAAGFEDRGLAGIHAMPPVERGRAILLTYAPMDERNDVAGIYEALRKKGISVAETDQLEYDRFNPHPFAELLRSRLHGGDTHRVILDVSAMSKLAMLLCLDVCRELELDVILYYTEAEQYGPTQKEYEQAREAHALHRPSIQIYTGVRGVLRVSRFSSVAMQGQPTAAIAFMSFNEELIQALLDSVYPTRLFLINGRPPVHKWREEATAWIHDRLIQEWPKADNPTNEGLPVRRASTLDYRETFEVLHDLYWSLTVDHRILLAPTGSKMQTLACFLAVSLHPDIHVEYPTPHGFLSLYSEGIGQSWLVNLGNINRLVAKLSALDQLQHLRVTADISSGECETAGAP